MSEFKETKSKKEGNENDRSCNKVQIEEVLEIDW